MEQSEQPQQKKSPIELAFNVVVVLLIAGAIAQVLQIRGLSDRVADLERQLLAQAEAEVAEQQGETNGNGWGTVIKSGLGGFEVTLPDGWGPVVKDKESDTLAVISNKQPDLGWGKKVEVTEVDGFGTDAPIFFSIRLADAGTFAPPQGEGQEFTFSNNKNPIKGTRYTYVYPKDELLGDEGVGMGARLAGDRDYTYVVSAGDKELRVFYRIYGSDPRNLVETVEEIVQRIVLAEQ